jgi:hypothetical protein
MLFDTKQIADFLSENGYATHPEGLNKIWLHDYVKVSDTEYYLDVQAEAVRVGKEVPDRPLRMTFRAINTAPGWRLASIEPIALGVQTIAEARTISKISPWKSEGDVYVCPVCRVKFASVKEFDVHACGSL